MITSRMNAFSDKIWGTNLIISVIRACVRSSRKCEPLELTFVKSCNIIDINVGESGFFEDLHPRLT